MNSCLYVCETGGLVEILWLNKSFLLFFFVCFLLFNVKTSELEQNSVFEKVKCAIVPQASPVTAVFEITKDQETKLQNKK